MKNFFRKMITVVLAVMMLTSCISFTAFAKETVNGNIWYGDELSVDVEGGTDGYNYMSLFSAPAHGYEFSGHFLGDGEGPQTFVIIDTAEYDGTTWQPNGIYSYGASNYDVVYCCDVETMIGDGIYYKRMNLEDSEYYTPEEAKKIRAIVSGSYPYVSLEEMKETLAENGYPYASELTRNEAIAAVQAAIWASANELDAEDLRYVKSYRVTNNYIWGQPLHDTSDEPGLDVTGKRVFKTYPEVGTRIDSLVDYLLALDGVEAPKGQIVITNIEIVKNVPSVHTDGSYETTLKVALNNEVSSEKDSLKLDVYVDGVLAETTDVALGVSEYEVVVEAKIGQSIKAVVSGTQELSRGVYFYAPRPADVDGDGIATRREVSQNLVGVASGVTAVHAEAEVFVPNVTEITVNKTWNDDDNRDGKRPAGVTVRLHADGVEVASKLLSEENNWSWTFEGLKVCGEDNNVITYTVTEDAVAGYEAIIEGSSITNVHQPELTFVEVNKIWDDANNQDGKRPETITVNLLANGKVINSKTVSAADGWKVKFDELYKYENGKEIVYTITEDSVAGYTTVINGYNVTNSYTPETVVISGSKTWVDNNDQDGKRPAFITINLCANDILVETKNVSAADNWSWTFENLPKYQNGKVIGYTIVENPVAGYESVVNGYDVTNIYTPETIDITVNKIWADENNKDGLRPDSITINLLADGKVVDTKVVTAADGWSWTVTGLDKFKDGKEIVYTVAEVAVEGYVTEIDGFTITNTPETVIEEPDVPLSDPKTTSVNVHKSWKDDNNAAGERPATITVNLFADGVKIKSKTVTSQDNWSWTFTNLPKYNGEKEIVYTVSEDPVEYYMTNISGDAETGYTIVNEYLEEIPPEDVPLTGDAGIVGALLVAIAAIATGALVLRKRRV